MKTQISPYYVAHIMDDWKFQLDIGLRAVTALGTVVIGLLAALIARRQARIASDKLKFDLFSKRYEVYQAIMSWIDKLQERRMEDEEYTEYMHKIEPVHFLFGEDINNWVRSLRQKARDMNHARRVLRDHEGSTEEHKRKMINSANETYSELTVDFDHEVERSVSLFAPYLSLGKTV